MFSNILISLSVITLVSVLLEIFLSDAQKAALSMGLHRAWYLLADLKKTRWLDWLRRRSMQTLILLGAAPLIGAFFLWAYLHRESRPDGVFDVAFIGSVAALSLGVGYCFIRFTLKAATLVSAVIRATLFLVVALAPAVSTGWFAVIHRTELTVANEPTLLQMLWVMAFISTLFITAGLVIAWASVALPLAIILALQGAIAAVEFILRRLAEYSKGLIVTVGRLLTLLT